MVFCHQFPLSKIIRASCAGPEGTLPTCSSGFHRTCALHSVPYKENWICGAGKIGFERNEVFWEGGRAAEAVSFALRTE